MRNQARLLPPLLPWMILLVAVSLAAVGCHDNNASRIHIELHDTPTERQAAAPRLATRPAPLSCWPGGTPPLQPSAAGVGDHKVFLKWNASVPSSNVSGYCLYRTTTAISPYPARAKPPYCDGCEQINAVPVTGTSCVDTVVKDGATYQYVVAAIGQWGLSGSSNPVTVVIPQGKQTAGSAPAGSYPPCRGPSTPSPPGPSQ